MVVSQRFPSSILLVLMIMAASVNGFVVVQRTVTATSALQVSVAAAIDRTEGMRLAADQSTTRVSLALPSGVTSSLYRMHHD